MKKYNVVVETVLNDEVEVFANSAEEAMEKAKREVSKCYEYVDYSSDNMKYIGGWGSEKVVECVEADETKCCICGVGKANNNAEPYKSGYCCDVCNSAFVIPARIEENFKNKK